MLRVILFFFIIDFVIVSLFLLLDFMLGHRLLIFFARILKFKQDDIEKTEQKVDEIFKKKEKTKRES